MPSEKAAKRLYKSAVEHHTFFRYDTMYLHVYKQYACLPQFFIPLMFCITVYFIFILWLPFLYDLMRVTKFKIVKTFQISL